MYIFTGTKSAVIASMASIGIYMYRYIQYSNSQYDLYRYIGAGIYSTVTASMTSPGM